MPTCDVNAWLGVTGRTASVKVVTDTADGPLRITLDTAAQLPTTRARIRSWLAEVVDRDDIDDILLASGEALANAFEHGDPPSTFECDGPNRGPSSSLSTMPGIGSCQWCDPAEAAAS